MRTTEAGGIAEGKLAEYEHFKMTSDEKFKDVAGCEHLSSNSYAYVSPPSTIVTPDVTEVRKTTSPGIRERVDLENRPEMAVLTPQNSNRFGILKVAEGGHSNHRELIQRQIPNYSTIPRWSYPPKLALKFKIPHKVPERESRLAPGTGVYYSTRRSIISKGYGKACTVEALSLLADVSCNLKRTHQRTSKSTPKLLEIDAHKERFNQRPWDGPWEKNTASAEKNVNHPFCKESYIDKGSKKMPLPAKEYSYMVVRKLRTPRKTAQALVLCSTKIRKKISLPMCDEYIFPIGARSSLTETNHLRERLATSGTSAVSSEISKKNLLGEGKFSDDKLMTRIIPVRRAGQKTTTLDRVPKAMHQLCGTKKRPFRGFKRAECFAHQILRFIREMTVPEKIIRQALGNNPDTSKALRLLVAQRKVMRLGCGGRGQAYEYVATEKGIHQLRELEQDVTEVVELTPEYASASSRSSITGAMIVSDGSKSEAQCFTIQHSRNPSAPAAGTNESQPSSVTSPLTPTMTPTTTPHRSFMWPMQSLKCVLSSESFELQSSGMTEC